MTFYDLYIIYFNRGNTVACNKLTNTDERHVITYRKQLINMLYQYDWAILVKLGEINMVPLIILMKT